MELSQVQTLISTKRYKEAAEALDGMLSSEKDDGDLWFLKGVVLLKIRNYDLAHECFERALEIAKKPEYYRVKGISHMEIFEVEKAIADFKSAVRLDEKDATSYFFLSIAYLFLDDPSSEGYLRKAKEIDGKRTMQLLRNFYGLFMKDDPRVSDAQKKRIEGLIGSMA